MKIKKHGKYYEKTDNSANEKFTCENCGCEFTAKEDEYYTDLGGAENYLTSFSVNSLIKDYLVCSCPECSKICKKICERKNQYSWTTVTGTNPVAHLDNVDYDKDGLPRPKHVEITCES